MGRMGKGQVFWVLLLLLCVSRPAGSAASVLAEDTNAAELDHAHRVRGALRMSGNTAILGGERCMDLPLSSFLVVDDSIPSVAPLSTSTTPGLAIESSTVNAFIEWADNEETPVQIALRVPDTYDSGGYFKVVLGRSGGGDPPSVDFEVFVNRDLTAFDVAATNQTAVELSNSIADGSPDQVTLTVATDFASLAAGDLVTFNLWRDNTDTSTDNLEFYGGQFCYQARD